MNWLRRRAQEQGPAPTSGEPLLTCFDCHRALSFGQLTVFPWWDERVQCFETMYRCERCLPKAGKQTLKQLTKHEEQLSRFVEFARQRVVCPHVVAPDVAHGPQALAYARQILEALMAHEAFIARR